MDFKFINCDFVELDNYLKKYPSILSSPIDSFLEEKILKSQHFFIAYNGFKIGYFSIYNKELLTQYYLEKEYKHLGETVFFLIKKMQFLKSAFVTTSDEFFLSHSIEDYKTINKQAYFFKDSKRKINENNIDKQISIKIAQSSDVEHIKKNTKDFFDILSERISKNEIYIASKNENIIGYGIMEKGVIMEGYVSIGMFIIEKYRERGFGRNVLLKLKEEAYKNNLIPIAGCWYYNHNSKKTLESAGMHSDTRLLRIEY